MTIAVLIRPIGNRSIPVGQNSKISVPITHGGESMIEIYRRPRQHAN